MFIRSLNEMVGFYRCTVRLTRFTLEIQYLNNSMLPNKQIFRIVFNSLRKYNLINAVVALRSPNFFMVAIITGVHKKTHHERMLQCCGHKQLSPNCYLCRFVFHLQFILILWLSMGYSVISKCFCRINSACN